MGLMSKPPSPGSNNSLFLLPYQPHLVKLSFPTEEIYRIVSVNWTGHTHPNCDLPLTPGVRSCHKVNHVLTKYVLYREAFVKTNYCYKF